MTHHKPYHPLTHSLTGILPACATVPGYRYVSPNGENLPCGIKGSPSILPKPTANYSLLTTNSSFVSGGGGLPEIGMEEEGQSELFASHQERFEELFNNLAACLDADFHSAEDMLKPLYKWQNVKEVETDCYWYHPDHLGSSSWITDSAGAAVQHLHYLPWGEDFVNQRLNSFDSVRYTFSAKEKDSETGLSYFGSRYYSSDLSIWLSVDPMSAKYPSLSPYVYCADNPVKLVDPNGEDWYIPENSTTPVWDKDVTRKNCPQNATYLGVEGCTYDGKIITHYQKDGEIKQYSASNSTRKGGFTFPVGIMTDSYKSGYAQFGTNRSNGTRKHAGCDLYAAVGTPVFAVSQGTVFEKAHFYKGTYSIAINHGSFSARYCELIPSFNVQVGMQVAEGDFLGMIGKMQGLSQSMLHFEMYNNSESGPLTNKTNGSLYFRRGDLMNPTSFLDNIRLGDYEKVPKCIYR